VQGWSATSVAALEAVNDWARRSEASALDRDIATLACVETLGQLVGAGSLGTRSEIAGELIAAAGTPEQAAEDRQRRGAASGGVH
jgi:hypothetical protein